ncbi:MAG: glucose-1-phosphate cytidylyltransferase [Paracoccaceae bacterium]
MKTVILAGGLGTRLGEETNTRPKPMVEIGDWPIIVHIMKIFSQYGHTNFLIACGYKSELIKNFFVDFKRLGGDLFVDLASGQTEQLGVSPFQWRVGCIETGKNTLTGGRILKMRKHIGNEAFMVTYGDGLGDINIDELLRFHRQHGKLATVTAVRPPARFGALKLHGSSVTSFDEKMQSDAGWINGGFFVFEPEIFNLIKNDQTSLELEPMQKLVAKGELKAYLHTGFWHPMDTIRDRDFLRELWLRGDAPWQN